MENKSTVDVHELSKFSQLAAQWWQENGDLKTLHDINPTRIEFINQCSAIKGKRILDVGCGGGILAEALAKMGGIVSAIDAEEEAINVAKIHAKKNKLSIDYQCLPIEEFKMAQFDIITCMEMLEHVTNPEMVIRHCARLLAPNGYLFLSTINRSVKAYATTIIAAEYLLNLLPRQTHDYQKFIKPSELAAMVRLSELDVIDLKGMLYNPILRKATLCKSVDANYLLACKAIG